MFSNMSALLAILIESDTLIILQYQQRCRRAPSGCTVPGRHVTESQAFGVEFLASFFLVFVVFACYDKSSMSQDGDGGGGKVKLKVKEREHPFVIGLTYTGVLLFAVS